METKKTDDQVIPADNLSSSQENNNALTHDCNTLLRQNQTLQDELVRLKQQLKRDDEGGETFQTLQLAELIIENSPAILFRRLAHDDPKLRKMVYVSPNISRFGYRAEDFMSGRIMFRDIVFKEDSERTLNEIQSFVKQNIEIYSQVYRIVTRQGDIRWIEDRTSVVDDFATGKCYHQGIVIDIHKRKVAEERLQKSEEKYRRIVETAGEGFLLMDESLNIVDLNSAYARMSGYSRSELIGKKPFELEFDEFVQAGAEYKGETPDREYSKFECEIESKDKGAVPVLIHANTLRSDSDKIIGNMAFVTDMTASKRALALAGEVQRSLLPSKSPCINGLDIAGLNVQCDEVGGDYFDYLWDADSDESVVSVVVGDITGHGVDSALLMSSARAFLRMRASQPGTITEIITAMNHHLTEDVYDTGRFMTLFYLTIDRSKKCIEWIRAGHDPAFVYDPGLDEFRELKGPGLALGVDQDYIFQVQREECLREGQVIVVGTDGLWEGCNRHGECFGKNRLKDIIRRNSHNRAETILDSALQLHTDFTQGVRTEDDITLVVIKVN
jgi:sigma-B regulation protein RsbU (phosphoserine phosphatase)